MEHKNQVCSPELAKKLKELGVEQDSLWWWIKNGKELIDKQTYEFKELMRPDDTDCSAFTVAELGMLLPEKRYDDDMWRQIWENEKNGFSEANARAKMLIYLLEKGTDQ